MQNDIKEIFSEIQKSGQRLLAIDFGLKRIGLAHSDYDFKIGLPLEVIENSGAQQTFKRLQQVIEEYSIGGIVIGLPTRTSGEEHTLTFLVKNFKEKLEEVIHLPIVMWDERFSSLVMERQLIEVADMSRAKRKKVLDKLAAGYFLQGALDYYQMLLKKGE